MSARLGQQVIIDNRAGAVFHHRLQGGSRSQSPTAIRCCSASSGLAWSGARALSEPMTSDPLKYFTPVASTSLLPHVMVVGPSVPAKTVAEFVAYAKANPGKLNYGAGLGTPPHLLSTLFKTQAGLDVTYIPYKGSAASVTDLLGGQTHFTIDGMLILIPQVKAGKLRALAVGRPERWPDLPDVPTLVESGYPDFVIDAWTGVMAPKGTPAAIGRDEAQRRHQRRAEDARDQSRPRPLRGAAESEHAAGVRGVPEGPTAEMGVDGETSPAPRGNEPCGGGISSVFCAAAAWPLAVRAQAPGKMPTIGVLGSGTASSQTTWVAAFVRWLQELGWIEGRTTNHRVSLGGVDAPSVSPRSQQSSPRLKVDVIFAR